MSSIAQSHPQQSDDEPYVTRWANGETSHGEYLLDDLCLFPFTHQRMTYPQSMNGIRYTPNQCEIFSHLATSNVVLIRRKLLDASIDDSYGGER